MEYKVVNALSRDVEREQLNKILKHISDTMSSVSTGGLTEDQVRLLIAESMPVVSSARPITVTLTGDATGSGSGTTSISIPVELTGNFVEDAPSDSLPYWRQDGDWQKVPFPILSLAYLSPSGFGAYNEEELEWNSRLLTGTSGNITVINGDGILGDPVFDLAPVDDSGTGSLLAITKDSYGRITGTKEATITGTSGQVVVANGDAVLGLPIISLADLDNSGVGTLRAITRDAKGRISGDNDATITGTADQIVVANGDASSGLPTLSLATAVTTSLGKADTAVQSITAGPGVIVDNTNPRTPIVSAFKAFPFVLQTGASYIQLTGTNKLPFYLASGVPSDIPVT